MPRIYALAKELNLDSKELVDICPKAGVPGKGSALASLSDDEVEKIKNYISGLASSRAPTRAAPAAPAPPPPAPKPSTPIRVLKSRPKAAPEPPAEEPAAPSTTPAAAGPPPLANKGKLRTLSGRAEKRGDAGKKPAEPSRGAPAGPVIRVAAMPEAKQPEAPATSEPTPQKPDIRLPADAIRSRTGTSALKKRVQELEKKKTRQKKTKGGEALPPGEAPPMALPGRGRGRGRQTRAVEEGERKGPITREKRKRGRTRGRRDDELESTPRSRRPQRIKRTGKNTALPRKGNAVVQLPCTVRSFSEAVGLPAAVVLLKLRDLTGALQTINSSLDGETAEMVAEELQLEVDFKQPVDLETSLLSEFEQPEDETANLQPRPPIVTFLGHVDHGKTSLLDRIIGTTVVEGEAGGITQHIRAYRVEHEGRAIGFVDTPGHEAFTEMRARGANVTDIAVLVIAADDGVMPQTEEALAHARAADVPIVVALNKMDLPGVDVNRVMQQLAAHELLPHEWGGETEVVKCSALTGEGVDELLETLLTIAELHEYKANPDRHAVGSCLEAERHEDRGVIAKLLVQNGTLKVGDVVVCGTAYGRVKAMYDTLRPTVRHEQATPSTPVNVTGLDEPPAAGERFYVLDEVAAAREIAEKRSYLNREAALGLAQPHISLESLRERLEEGTLGKEESVQTLNLILRADTRGSIEAVQKELGKLEHPEVRVKLLQCLVGGITEADVHLADASDAVIIGFNVVPDEKARILARDRGVQIRRYDVIYRVTEDIRAALEGLLKPEEHERELGRALVQRVFTISRVGSIAGCRVLSGTIRRDGQVRVRVIRDSTVIGDYPLESLRREKDDAREVREGFECGIKLAGFNDVKEGDLLDAYTIEEVARTL